MLLGPWYGLVGLAVLFTLGWLLLAERIAFTGLAASAFWFMVSYTGDSVYKQTACCTYAVDVAPYQWAATAFAVLSLLAVVLNWFGHYPPEQQAGEISAEQPTDDLSTR